MKAKIRANGELLEDIDVDKGLRQGCSMAPTLFNLYACLVAERWKEVVAGIEGVAIVWRYKLDQKLFRRYTTKACESQLTECKFADDLAIFATTREGAKNAMRAFVNVASDFGLQLGELPKD